MPYKFKIINANTSQFIQPQTSQLANTYITYSLRGTVTDGTNDLIWVTTADPKPTTATSAGMRFYNPEHNIYLGDTEQPANSAPVNGSVASVSGTVAGAPDFTTPGIASKWFLQSSGTGQYKIYCHDGTNNIRRLVMDVNNNNRAVISSELFTNTSNLSELWTIQYV